MNITLFSQNIYLIKNTELPHEKILKEIKGLKWSKVFPQILTPNYDTKQYISEYNILDTLSSEIKKNIKLKFEHCLKEAIKSFGFDTDFIIHNSWVNKIKPGNYSEFHNHRNFFLSLVYYPHGNFSIIFKKHEIDFFEINIKKQNSLVNNLCSIPVGEGDIVIFPAYMLHKIGFNNTKTNRYSIAVNVLPAGIVGKEDGKIFFKK